MKYYQQLIKQMDRSMRAYPRSTVVMDSDSLKIIARGRNTTKLTRKLNRAKTRRGVAVVFRRLDDKAVWILATRPAL